MLIDCQTANTSFDIDQTYEEPLTIEQYCSPPDREYPERFSTLVHTPETSDRFSDSVSYRATVDQFRDPTYSRIRDAYAELDQIDGTRREAQLLDCHTLAYFARHSETGEVKVFSRRCGLRWCPVCQKSRQGRITHEVAEWLKMFKHPKILTLTMKHSDRDLGDQIRLLYDNFRNLRRRKFFSSKVTGGCWFFQIKKSKTDGLWHPHIHCLITGLFVPRDDLSKLWLEITGDSPVCDIRAVKDPDTAVRHVARYAAAPCDLTNLSSPEITEIIQAMHGRRIFGTWGLGKSINLKPEKPPESGAWVNIGSWSTVYEMRNLDDNAKRIFQAWKLSLPLGPGVTMIHSAELIDEGFAMSAKPPPAPYLSNFYN